MLKNIQQKSNSDFFFSFCLSCCLPSCQCDQILPNVATLALFVKYMVILRDYLVSGKVLNLLWQLFSAVWQIFIPGNGQILNKRFIRLITLLRSRPQIGLSSMKISVGRETQKHSLQRFRDYGEAFFHGAFQQNEMKTRFGPMPNNLSHSSS